MPANKKSIPQTSSKEQGRLQLIRHPTRDTKRIRLIPRLIGTIFQGGEEETDFVSLFLGRPIPLVSVRGFEVIALILGAITRLSSFCHLRVFADRFIGVVEPFQ